jgi:hypothetical protein
VVPNTDYTLTGWVRTSSNHADGYFGARVINGGPISEARFTQPLGSYTQLTVSFNSGANHSVELFAGTWALNGDTWLQVDDVSLTRR